MFSRSNIHSSFRPAVLSFNPFSGNRSGLQRRHNIKLFFRLGREFPSPALSIAGRVPSSSMLPKINACFNPPTMPSADFCTALRLDYSTLSPYSKDTVQISQGKTRNFQCINAGFIKHTPLRMEDLVVTCPLVPDVPHLRSGSCTSPCIFGLDFLQTSSRDDALALLLTLGSANTWCEDSHLTSYVPCLAHTSLFSRSD